MVDRGQARQLLEDDLVVVLRIPRDDAQQEVLRAAHLLALHHRLHPLHRVPERR